MQKKSCTKCGNEKELTEFRFSNKEKTKYRSDCRECERIAFKRWNEANREYRKEYQRSRIEQKRLNPEWVEEEKEKTRKRSQEYTKANPEAVKQAKAKYREANREKINAKSRERYQANWEKERERKRKYEQTEEAKIKRRITRLNYIARKKGAQGNYKKEDFLSLFNEGDQDCYLCGCSISQFDFHIEHKTPLSRGGSNEIDNIGISCMTCNVRKGNRTEEEFREYLAANPYEVPEYRPKAAGQHHGNAKLTLEEVLNLRQEFIVGVHTCRLWAEFYNVSERVIGNIVRGKSWMSPEAIPDGWKPIDKLPKHGSWSKHT